MIVGIIEVCVKMAEATEIKVMLTCENFLSWQQQFQMCLAGRTHAYKFNPINYGNCMTGKFSGITLTKEVDWESNSKSMFRNDLLTVDQPFSAGFL